MKLSDNFNKERDKLILISFLTLLLNFSDFNSSIKIPFLNIDVSINENTLIILLCLNIYFVFRFILEWKKSDFEVRKKNILKMDFYASLILSITSSLITIYTLTDSYWIWDTETMLSIVFILIIGEMVAITLGILLSILVFIRDKDEVKKQYLSRIPYALKVQLIWIPIDILLLVGTWFIVTIFMNQNIQEYWIIILLIPIVIQLVSLIRSLIFPNYKARENIKKALDEHEIAISHCDDKYNFSSLTKSNISTIFKKLNDEEYKEVYNILNKGYSPNENIGQGWTPFLVSIANGDIRLAKLYFEYGANINTKNMLGRSAIYFATHYNYYELIVWLIENGANINISSGHASPPIMIASEKGYLKIVKLLIDLGVDTNVKDFEGKTSLDYAEKNQHGEIAKILRKLSLDTKGKNKIKDKNELQ